LLDQTLKREVTNDSFICRTTSDHVEAELAGDLDATMATMTDDPHLNHVPTMAGGVGHEGVQAFYRDHLVGKFFPPDVTMTNVSRTAGQDQVVDEIAIKFTTPNRSTGCCRAFPPPEGAWRWPSW
jgi:hypothetical protein